jgi:hypothetical protein
VVWVSGGKHASFLRQDLCRGGCGADDCTIMLPLTPANLVNIGDPGAAMNGALWANSPRWPLAHKMRSDFSDAVLARIEASTSDVVIEKNKLQVPVKPLYHSADKTTGAISMAGEKTDAAMSAANASSSNAVDTATTKVGGFFNRAMRTVKKVFSSHPK